MPYYNEQINKNLKQALEKIKTMMYTKIDELDSVVWVTSEPVPFSKRLNGQKKKIRIGETWGNLWDCGWFNFTGKISDEAREKKVVLLIDVNGEGCVFDSGGCPIRGLTNISSSFDFSLGEPGKRVVQLLDNAKGGEEIDIWVEVGCNDLFGRYSKNGTLENADIALCNEEMRNLYYDFQVLYDLMISLPEDSARYSCILFTLNDAAKVLQEFTEEEAKRARDILGKELNKKGGDASLNISAIGHAHIDLAWLWPIRETIRKGSRTISTVVEMMERYPDYVFGASQPQLYLWMKEHYPSLYQKIKGLVEEGRWEVQGGMWVEPDTNITGAESLVRQLLYGKRFFREEFNKDMKILWLPDVFGYTGSLPQILKKSGVDYFMTIKLSWNEHNTFPHHTFTWEGIDGSTVLAHMPPEGTYNSSASPNAIIKTEKQFLDKGLSDKCLMLFGIGDGGGGPGAEHLERLNRVKNLAGLPPVVQEQSIDFFEKIDKDSHNYKKWVGELYLEKHQGTLTSQAKNKKFNRLMEIKLRELEYISSLMTICTNKLSYPQDELETTWKKVLLYQFHDILPGSSIKRVYDESLEDYELMYERVNQLVGEWYSNLATMVSVADMQIPYLLANSLSWERKEWLKINNEWVFASIPSLGYTTIDMECIETNEAYVKDLLINEDDKLIENDVIRVVFNEKGYISSIYDKETDREVIDISGEANSLAVYEDRGDAWDFHIDYREKMPEYFKLETTRFSFDGPKIIAKNLYSYGKSILRQEVIITHGSKRVDFKTAVQWQEANKMLRTSFPVNIYSSDAICDIQFGTIKRSTHENTTWDMAKFEVCAHKWADLSQRDYGVALMNDCKYGYSIKGNILDLNLLRSTRYPGVQSDIGDHEFLYSIYPHVGDHIIGNVSRAAYELNVQTYSIKVDSSNNTIEPTKSFLNLESSSILVEAVKKAEDDESIIVRLYENSGGNVKTTISSDWNIESIYIVDMMEENPEEVYLDEGKYILEFKPFEIITLKMKLSTKQP